MYHRFRWTAPSRRRNGISAEYEPLQPYFLLALIEAAACKTFVDVGANIGAYSVLMSQAPSIEKIIAFEANPIAAREMDLNLARNSVDAEVCAVAVSDRTGALAFGRVSRLAGNSAAIETAEDQTFYRIDEIECVSLDDTLQSYLGPFALKIDVEGHEKQVLDGASRVLLSPCVIQVENYAGYIKLPEDFYRITQIGPDCYYSNIQRLDAIRLFELASAMMIEANHEVKAATIHAGNFAISVSGKSYEIIKRIALKLFSSQL
jgi:FkbM family methyltransferase